VIRALGAFFALCLLLTACSTSVGVRHSEIPPLNGQKASFDQAAVDQSTHRLYLADGALTAIDVFDVGTDQPHFLSSVKLGHAPHGLAVSTDLHKVFAGIDGGAVAVIEADPAAKSVNTVIATIQTSAKKNVDLLDYDPTGHLLWAASSGEGILTKIDAIRNLAISHLDLAPGLEQPRHDPAGNRLYLPNMTKNLLYQIDPVTLSVLKQSDLGVPCAPTGMGIDAKRKVAMLGCSDPAIAYTLEWNLATGQRVRTFTEIGSADQVVYDPANDLFLVAGMSNGVTAIGFFGGSPVASRSVKLTHADTRAVAINDASKVVFTPDAHPGEPGLISFSLPDKENPAPPLLAPLLYLLPLLLVGLAVWYFGSRRQRERRLAGRPMYS
jgi:DNA-binding beta-propeller fold protein YncE